jgi:carbon monoxide dehydrogenase subunit G
MDLSDEIFIPAPRDAVFAALNDPAILKEAIPGCESLTQVSDSEMEATVVLKVGPVKARFGGKVTLDRSGGPAAMSLSGEGNGGVAGFAKGGASVELTEEDGGTRLKYTARADVGGKIAQLGGRLILGTARKLSENFFANFARVLSERQGA